MERQRVISAPNPLTDPNPFGFCSGLPFSDERKTNLVTGKENETNETED